MSDTIQFIANDVSLDPQVGFIGFADQASGHYFWMQPSETTSAKDEIWLERDGQPWGGCGGAWNIALTRNKFVIHTQNLHWMACDAVEVAFAVDNATYARLKEILQRVMIGCLSDLDIQD